MKFLIFALVVASILEDYGTFQEKAVNQCKDIELVGMFKKYALELVEAAAEPFLECEEFMIGGCECLSGVNAFDHVNFKDPMLATMSIAKNYWRNLQLIRNTEDSKLPRIMSKIEPGMMINIRLILVVLQTSQYEIDENSDNAEYAYNKYLVRPNQRSSTSAARAGDDRNLESRLKCMRTLVGIEENEEFVLRLDKGFDILRKLMTRDNNTNPRDPLWDDLDKIIEDMPEYDLELPPPQTKEDLESFLRP